MMGFHIYFVINLNKLLNNSRYADEMRALTPMSQKFSLLRLDLIDYLLQLLGTFNERLQTTFNVL